MYRLSFVLLLGALVFSACDTASTDGEEAAARVASASTEATPATLTLPDGQTITEAPVSRHMVYARRMPRNFESTVEGLGGTVSFLHKKTGFALVDGLSDDAANDLLAIRGVNEVLADITLDRDPEDNEIAPRDASVSSPTGSFAYGLGLQWHMDAVGAPAAWAAGRTGSSDVTVAIIDSGLDPVHNDLVGRIDEARSRAFLPAGEFDYLVRDVNFAAYPDWLDLNGHGTHVGSTVSSNADVASGVTDQTTLIAVKACRVDNSCSGSAIIAGVLYAADAGADVANMSLGGSFDKSDVAAAGFASFTGFINRTFNYAKRKGMTIVVSAGNSAVDLDRDGDSYKTYCDTPGTICVSATAPSSSADNFFGPFFDITDPASYTNYGRGAIDLAAPGGDSAGFVWAACSSTQLDIFGGFLFTTPCTFNTTFTTALAGTSMAAPHVSGLAALLVEDYGRNPRRIQNRMQQTADDLGPRGADKFYGKGYINIPAALGVPASPLP